MGEDRLIAESWRGDGGAPTIGFGSIDRLTRRQRFILAACCDPGGTRAEVAARLGRSEHTVKNTLTRIYAALGVAGREAACALWWRDRGWRDRARLAGVCAFCGVGGGVGDDGVCRRCAAVRDAAEAAVQRAQERRALLRDLEAAGLVVPVGGCGLDGPRAVLIRQPDAALLAGLDDR